MWKSAKSFLSGMFFEEAETYLGDILKAMSTPIYLIVPPPRLGISID